jgi:excisionase family DNA binding protein
MKPHKQSERLWTAEQVAHYLSVSKSWVYRSATDGRLPSVRIGSVLRFLPASVEALVNNLHTAKGGTP